MKSSLQKFSNRDRFQGKWTGKCNFSKNPHQKLLTASKFFGSNTDLIILKLYFIRENARRRWKNAY